MREKEKKTLHRDVFMSQPCFFPGFGAPRRNHESSTFHSRAVEQDIGGVMLDAPPERPYDLISNEF
ncbi:MAG: hypothetical protein GTO18_10345 [Anaerolineales bacterium]|nr:hypothetical protein [Anaerolineales bacterium]